MIFESKDEKLQKIENRIHEMERRMENDLQKMNDTITAMRDIILRLQTENNQLRSEKDFLVERHKKMLKRVPVPDLASDIKQKLAKPVAEKIRENAEFVQLIAKEGFVEIRPKVERKKPVPNPVKELKKVIEEKSSNGKSIDRLFEIISEKGRIRSDEASRRMNVHEVQIEEWAKVLEDHEMISVKKTQFGRVELSKI